MADSSYAGGCLCGRTRYRAAGRLASLDEPGALEPTCHIWVSNKLPWVVLGDGLPQHARWRSGGA